MSLPGKLCIGILEEDNPLKSYFRFKPLLIEDQGKYVPYTQEQCYPEDGCIRIVPDKNESFHFKARMRRIGLFSVVDLRAHPDENDKIRPNKNYREGGAEQNAFIIYSDVVRGPAPDMIFEILPQAGMESPVPAPRTPSVLLRGEALSPARWTWEPVDEAGEQARLVAGEGECDLDGMQVFDLPGFREETVSFAIVPADRMEKISDMPEPHAPAHVQPAPELPKAAGPEPAPPEGPVPPEEPPEEDKPWLHHDSSMAPSPVDSRLSPAQRILAAQAGLNPRRGRSLQELIDEKWQQSRLNQLGQPVAPIVTGAPLVSPVEAAVNAVREAWNQPQMRRDLLESLGGIDEFGASLQECREAARQRDIEQHLNALEARRLALLGELERLQSGGAELRRQLKQEIRRDEAADLADAVRKTEAAREAQARFERLAAEARAAARDARQAVDALTGEELERRLRDFALNGRMMERLAQLKGEAEPLAEPPELAPVDAEGLLQRVMTRFEAAGRPLSRRDALNLCACLAVSPVLILGGPVGCGKGETARLLAEALGWTGAGRFAAFPAGEDSLGDDARLAELARLPESPAMLLLPDANRFPGCDPFRGLDAALRPAWRLCATVQDSHSGFPWTAPALDRGFMVRLNSGADAPWQPLPDTATLPEPPVSLDALAEWMPHSEADVPAACAEHMEALRRALARCGAPVSRRALDETWRYCGVMTAGLGEEADPMEIIDLAVAQRLLPALLASATAPALSKLPALLEDLPVSLARLDEPLPVLI